MTILCYHVQIHFSEILNTLTFFDLGKRKSVFNKKLSRDQFNLYIKQIIQPFLKTLEHLRTDTPEPFRFSLGMDGLFIDEARQNREVRRKIRELVKSGITELAGQTYYNSPAHLFSKTEFDFQVKKHQSRLMDVFNYKATTFHNTLPFFASDLADRVKKNGFHTLLSGNEISPSRIKKPNRVYGDVSCPGMNILFRHPEISKSFSVLDFPAGNKPGSMAKMNKKDDQVIFFSTSLFPSVPEKTYTRWLTVYFKPAFEQMVKDQSLRFILPADLKSSLIKRQALAPENFPGPFNPVKGNDLSPYQKQALKNLFRVYKPILHSDKNSLLKSWRQLQSWLFMEALGSNDNFSKLRYLTYPELPDLPSFYLNLMNSINHLEIQAFQS